MLYLEKENSKIFLCVDRFLLAESGTLMERQDEIGLHVETCLQGGQAALWQDSILKFAGQMNII